MTKNPWDEVGGIPPYLPLPVTNAHFRALGHVAAMWSSVELQTQYLLWEVLGVDEERGKLLTAALRFDTSLDVLGIIAATTDRLRQDQKFAVSDLITEAKRLSRLRNDVVHAAWAPGDDLSNPVAHRLRMKDRSRQPYSPADLERIAIEINALLRRMLQLYLDLRFA